MRPTAFVTDVGPEMAVRQREDAIEMSDNHVTVIIHVKDATTARRMIAILERIRDEKAKAA